MSNLSIVTSTSPATHTEEDGLMHLAMTIAAIRASEPAPIEAGLNLAPMTVIAGTGVSAPRPAAHGLRLL